ncbi:MAG: FAD-dependent oxidoreductase, partial [Bacillota bacterium]
MQYVIIGNSIAAVGCIDGIRRADPDGAITVVGREPYHVYSRPLISYLLLGKTDLDRMAYRPWDYYERNGCTLLKGKSAVNIDPKAHSVTLDDGTKLPYDKLLVATGSRPFVPPIKGLDTVGEYHTFMTLDDA